MVQGYYSLTEAANILGMTTEELNRMAQKREIRAFADGGSWKFRQQDIEELRRTRQFGSDPSVRMADNPLNRTESVLDDDEEVVLDSTGLSGAGLGAASDSAATVVGLRGPQGSDSDVRLVINDEQGSDSDVRLVPDVPSSGKRDEGIDLGATISDDIIKSPSDSDVRLAFDDPGMRPPQDMGQTEEINLEAEGLGATMDFSSPPKPKKDLMKTESASQSDFDLKFDDDLGQGFKIEESSEFDIAEFDAGAPKAPPPASKGSTPAPATVDQTVDLDASGSDVFALAGGSDSGINLESPDDSGISLEEKASSSDSEFELSLESDEDIFASDDLPGFKEDDDAPPAKVAARVPVAAKTDESSSSDSDFELAIDEDFEIEDESGSEVVAIDEDVAAEEDEEEEAEIEDDFGDELTPVGAAVAGAAAGAAARGRGMPVAMAAPPWPTWILIPVVFNTVLLALVGIMLYEIMRNAWSYNTPWAMNGTVISGVRSIAQMIGLAK